MGVTHPPRHRDTVRTVQRRLEMGVGICITHILCHSPHLLPCVLPHLQQEGDRPLGFAEEQTRGSMPCQTHCSVLLPEEQTNGHLRRKETGAQQCLTHLKHRANKREGGEQDLWQ